MKTSEICHTAEFLVEKIFCYTYLLAILVAQKVNKLFDSTVIWWSTSFENNFTSWLVFIWYWRMFKPQTILKLRMEELLMDLLQRMSTPHWEFKTNAFSWKFVLTAKNNDIIDKKSIPLHYTKWWNIWMHLKMQLIKQKLYNNCSHTIIRIQRFSTRKLN